MWSGFQRLRSMPAVESVDMHNEHVGLIAQG